MSSIEILCCKLRTIEQESIKISKDIECNLINRFSNANVEKMDINKFYGLNELSRKIECSVKEVTECMKRLEYLESKKNVLS